MENPRRKETNIAGIQDLSEADLQKRFEAAVSTPSHESARTRLELTANEENSVRLTALTVLRGIPARMESAHMSSVERKIVDDVKDNTRIEVTVEADRDWVNAMYNAGFPDHAVEDILRRRNEQKTKRKKAAEENKADNQ